MSRIINSDHSCQHCGYNLRMLRTGQKCPECGKRIRLRNSQTKLRQGLPGISISLFLFASCGLLAGAVWIGRPRGPQRGLGLAIGFYASLHIILVGIKAIVRREMESKGGVISGAAAQWRGVRWVVGGVIGLACTVLWAYFYLL